VMKSRRRIVIHALNAHFRACPKVK